VMDRLTSEIAEAAQVELTTVLDLGGAVEALDHMKAELVRANAERLARIESGNQVVVGVNAFTEGEPSPLLDEAEEGGFLRVDDAAEHEQVARLEAWRSRRDGSAATAAIDELRRVAGTNENIVPASIAAARAGVTTGEWAEALRETFGEYRGPTGVSGAGSVASDGLAETLADGRRRVAGVEQRLGRKLRILIGKPGLDGHSNGAEQVAVRARDLGMEVIYEGIRLTPAQIVRAAVDEDVHVVGLSVLSGSHATLIPAVIDGLRAEQHDVPVVAGGIIPPADAAALKAAGVAAVFTPKDYELTRVLVEVAELAADRLGTPTP